MHAKTRRREVRVTVDNSLDAFPEGGSSKIQKQPQRLLRQPQVSQQLLAMDGSKLLDRFDFDDQRALDDQVCPEALRENDAVIFNRDRHLPVDIEARFAEHRCKYRLVDGLEQTGSQVSVKAETAIDDRPRDLFRIVQGADSLRVLRVFA